MRLCKLHYGSIEELKKMTSREIIQILNFERFENDVELVRYQKQKRDKECL